MNTGKLPEGMTALSPMLTVKDIDAAVAFYTKAFGFGQKAVMPGPDGKTMHAELQHGGVTLMLGAESNKGPCNMVQPAADAPVSLSLYLYVEDVDKFFAHATQAGAKVKQPCTDMFWGDRVCGLQDPFGHYWSFGTFKKQVTPAEMKAAMQAQMAGAKK